MASGKETASFKEHGTFKENYLYATMHGIHLQNADGAPPTSTLPINVQCSIILMYYKIFNSNKQWDFCTKRQCKPQYWGDVVTQHIM